ncbi:MAG TPA: hypothetical protein VFI44_08565 [Ornithinibacter sp.]|nr:hypothetical protein [Ornithinibacter sp.]
MSRSLSLVLGAVLVLVGVLWTGQGLGWIGGSAMTGLTVWAVIGPVVALGGIALVVRGIRTHDG